MTLLPGYVMGQLERIPVPGDTIELDGVLMRVQSMDDLRIDRLAIFPKTSVGTE